MQPTQPTLRCAPGAQIIHITLLHHGLLTASKTYTGHLRHLIIYCSGWYKKTHDNNDLGRFFPGKSFTLESSIYSAQLPLFRFVSCGFHFSNSGSPFSTAPWCFTPTRRRWWWSDHDLDAGGDERNDALTFSSAPRYFSATRYCSKLLHLMLFGEVIISDWVRQSFQYIPKRF